MAGRARESKRIVPAATYQDAAPIYTNSTAIPGTGVLFSLLWMPIPNPQEATRRANLDLIVIAWA